MINLCYNSYDRKMLQLSVNKQFKLDFELRIWISKFIFKSYKTYCLSKSHLSIERHLSEDHQT